MATYLTILYGASVGRKTAAHQDGEAVLADILRSQNIEAAILAAAQEAEAKAAAMKAEQEAFDQARKDRELDYLAEKTVDFVDYLGNRYRGQVDIKAAKKATQLDRHAGGLKAAKIEAVTKMLTDQVRSLAKANDLNDRERWEAAIALCRGLRGTHPRNILDRVPIGDVVKESYK